MRKNKNATRQTNKNVFLRNVRKKDKKFQI